MFLALTIFYDSFLNIVTITFSALIFIEMLNIVSETTKLKKWQYISIIVTLFVYMMSIILFRNYIAVDYIDVDFCLRVTAISVACWLPFYLW